MLLKIIIGAVKFLVVHVLEDLGLTVKTTSVKMSSSVGLQWIFNPTFGGDLPCQPRTLVYLLRCHSARF